MKKFLLIILSVLCALCTLLGVACKDKENGGETAVYTLNETVMELKLFEEKGLIAYDESGAEVTASWSASNDCVAVDSEGIVTGKALGEATVTATIGESTVSCTVTVVASETVPMFKLINTADLTLQEGDEWYAVPFLSYQGKGVDVPADITYTSSDPNAVEVVKNATGSCTIKAKAPCNGVTVEAACRWNGILLTYKATVRVLEDVTIYLDNTAINLYTYETETSPVEQTVTVTKVECEGETVENPEITWSTANADIATVDENGKITAKSFGTTTVYAEWTSAVSGTYKSEVGVNVLLTTMDKTDMTATDIFLREEDGDATIALADYGVDLGTDYNGITVYDITDEENPIAIASTTYADGNCALTKADLTAGERVISVEKANHIRLTFKACVISLCIDSKAKLLNWQSYIQKGEVQSTTNSRNRTTSYWTYDGYVVLGADIALTRNTTASGNLDYATSDIVATENFRPATTGSSAYGFAGTFDGRGYTISGGAYGAGGLFGGVAESGVIKNLAITNAAIMRANLWYSGLGKTGYNTSDTEEWAYNALIAWTFWGKMENCLIDALDMTTDKFTYAFADKTRDSAGDASCTVFYAMKGTLKNVVVYTDRNNNNSYYVKTLSSSAITTTLENVFLFTDKTDVNVDGTNVTLSGLTKGLLTDTVSATMVQKLTGGVWSLTEGAAKAAFVTKN